MKSKLGKKLCIIAGHPEKFGTGHVRRMQILKRYLNSEKIFCTIYLWKDKPPIINVEKFDAFLLDRRDSSFPEELSGANSKKPLIAIDNFGEGRKQADCYFDILQHTSMTDIQIANSLRLTILPRSISSLENRSFLFQVRYKKTLDACLKEIRTEKKKGLCILSTGKKRNPPEKFRRNLIHAPYVILYYGQTLLEAAYLGKKSYLYDISDYHEQLNRFFCEKVVPLLAANLDSYGAQRLALIIAKSIEGVS